LAHIETCRKCGAYAESLAHLRVELRRLSDVAVPSELGARLRVMASHERERWLTRVSMSARAAYWASRARLTFDNLMRPLALPFAGGSLAALITFSLLVPNLSFPHNFGDQSWFKPPVPQSDYVPGVIHGALVVRADTVVPEGANAVELTIDEQGKVRNYSLVSGSLTPDLQSIIILPPLFHPATVLDLPIPAKVRVIERQSPNNRS